MRMEFKNVYDKKSTKIILSCIMVTTMVLTNSVIAKGTQVNNSSISSFSNITNTTDQHKFIIDPPVKFYDNIEKVEQVVNFEFKAPDFFPNGYKIGGFELRKLSDKDSVLGIIFENENGNFSLQISEEDPAELLILVEREKSKAIENSKVESLKQPMRFGEINGLNIILTTTLPARQIGEGYSKESKTVSNYFAWKDQGLWYSIEYNSTSKSEENNNDSVTLSNEEVKNIAKSLKYPEDIKAIDYSVKKDVSTEVPTMNIYDIDDVKKATKALGFNIKFPTIINGNINITGSLLGVSGESDIKNNKIIYELNNFYSNKNGSITFTQAKNLSAYEEIKNNGNINAGNDTGEQIQVDKLNINNNEVFKYSPRGFAPQVNYLWKENNIYYSVTFFVNVENSNEIVKDFINSKALE